MYYQTKEALIEKHFYSMSIKDVVGRGASAISFYSQEDEKMANSAYSDPMIAKKMIEIYVRDQDVEELIDTIRLVNSKNQAGDGKIFVLPLERCQRIHTGEINDNALM
jgi:nitrogen regulatory protein PII